MRYPLNERRVKVGYAFRDPWFSTGKLHTGEDDHATAGEAVYAPAAGILSNHIDDPKWGHGVVIRFDGGDGCTLWHVDHFLADGTHVAEGQQIATVYNLQGNTHLHVSFWTGSFDANLTVGALPPAQFPDRFVEPDHYLDSHPTTQGDDPLTKSDFEAIVRLAFVAGCGREPSPKDLTDYENAINDQDAGAVITGVLDSPEGQAWRDHLNKAKEA